VKKLSFTSKLSIYLLSMLFVVFCIIILIFYRHNSREEMKDAELYSTALLQRMSTDIRANLTDVAHILAVEKEQILRNHKNHDEIMDIITDFVRQDNLIMGGSVAFEPNSFEHHSRLCMEYAYIDSVGTIRRKHISDESNYDYLQMAWYSDAVAASKCILSEPYYDSGAGEKLMITYSDPLIDEAGKVYGVMTADISLDDLTKEMERAKPYEECYPFILSHSGTFIALPSYAEFLREDLGTEVPVVNSVGNVRNEELQPVLQAMMAGKSGTQHIRYHGDRVMVCFTQMEGIDWSIAYIATYDSILEPLGDFTLFISVIMIAALLFLALFAFLIIHRQSRPIEALTVAAADKERMEHELAIAHDIQMRLMLHDFSEFDNALYALLRPAKEVGGDFYDVVRRDGKIFFTVGDVSGKGVPASLIMATTCTHFRILSQSTDNPEVIVSQMNRSLCEDNDTNMFVTAFVGVIDTETREMRFCNAGHNPGMIMDKSGEPRFMQVKANLALGVLDDFQYEMESLQLKPGEMLLIYTDGLTEAENREHKLLGDASALSAFGCCYRHTAEDAVDIMTQAVVRFADGAEQSDDLTLLAYAVGHTLEMEARIDELTRLPEFLEVAAADLAIPAEKVMPINLALEEALVNVINYGFPDGGVGRISLRIDRVADTVRFMITDNGIPFDPTAAPEADTTSSVEDRSIGGLGIHLMRSLMTSITYRRTATANKLLLTLEF
jgi:sigma-B regulation protein RsbU (phosphoserine phosphatase)